jgi:hypothetical protein
LEKLGTIVLGALFENRAEQESDLPVVDQIQEVDSLVEQSAYDEGHQHFVCCEKIGHVQVNCRFFANAFGSFSLDKSIFK